MNAVLVVAPTHFRDEECLEPLEILTEKGFDVHIASLNHGTCTGRFGATVEADMTLEEAKEFQADIVAFVGGNGAEVYLELPLAHELAWDTLNRHAVLGAICLAPVILANAGILKDIKATAFPTEEENVRCTGAIWTGENVQEAVHEASGSPVITANGPHAASEFAQALCRAYEARN